jgi:hypothetical protein
MYRLRSLELWDRGFESHARHGCLYMHLFCVRRADHSSKESYRLFKNDYETEEEARAQQRAVEPLINGWMGLYVIKNEVETWVKKVHSSGIRSTRHRNKYFCAHSKEDNIQGDVLSDCPYTSSTESHPQRSCTVNGGYDTRKINKNQEIHKIQSKFSQIL